MEKVVDITPTWNGVLPVLLAGYCEGTSKGRQIAEKELRRMARAADQATAHPVTLKALTVAERFISGFEGDELQEGVADMLRDLRAALKLLGAGE